MQRVKSSVIHSIGHTTDGLAVRFHAKGCDGGDCDCKGHIYDYPTVTAKEHDALVGAPSIGAHFSKLISRKHSGVKR